MTLPEASPAAQGDELGQDRRQDAEEAQVLLRGNLVARAVNVFRQGSALQDNGDPDNGDLLLVELPGPALVKE